MSRYFNDWFFSSGEYLKDMPEKWEPLRDHPGYWICREGYVMNSKGHILKDHKGDKHGHISIHLGRHKEEYLHRLLAKQYLPNPNNYPVVRHLDDDYYNNSITNLAWGTQYDNHLDCVRNGNYKSFTDEMREKSYKRSRVPVIATDLETGEDLYFIGENEAARTLHVQQSNLFKVLVGNRQQTCGYSFRYAKKGEKDEK